MDIAVKPLFLENEDWYYKDNGEGIYKLTELGESVSEVKESYVIFYKELESNRFTFKENHIELSKLDFEYSEDYDFFDKHLHGGVKENSQLFDFRDPKEKRKEFAKLRKKLLPEILKRDNNQCQLHFEGICDEESGWQVDHVIPLSTNVLNKKLRMKKAELGKKVVTETYGSNHIDNLVLACKKCNGHKKHNIYIDGVKTI